MLDYVAFFSLNIAALLFSIVVWRIIPKPKPSDYTTVPGLKLEKELPQTYSKELDWGQSDGHLREIAAFSTFSDFLTNLHSDYGPVASFFWGPRYVLSIGTWDVYQELLSKSHYLKKNCNVRDVFAILKASSLSAFDESKLADYESLLKQGPFCKDLNQKRQYTKRTTKTHHENPMLIAVEVEKEMDLFGYPVPSTVPIVISLALIERSKPHHVPFSLPLEAKMD